MCVDLEIEIKSIKRTLESHQNLDPKPAEGKILVNSSKYVNGIIYIFSALNGI